MTNALDAITHSMQADLRYLETVSQNMANVSTPGYKRSIPSAQAFDDALQAGSSAHLPSDAMHFFHAVDLSPGALQQTNRTLDVAISGDGYFEFSTPDGPAYGRAGNFQVDATGRLVTPAGFAVQGQAGDIVARGAPPLIDQTGHVMQAGEVIDRIKIVRFENPKDLVKAPNGLLVPNDGSTQPIEVSPELQSGYLEGSNVSPMREMIAMLETARHFESAQKLFQGYDDVLSTAIRKLGEF